MVAVEGHWKERPVSACPWLLTPQSLGLASLRRRAVPRPRETAEALGSTTVLSEVPL